MLDNKFNDADLDALFRRAAENEQKRYESTLWLSIDSGQPRAVADQVSPGDSSRDQDMLPDLNRPDPIHSDA